MLTWPVAEELADMLGIFSQDQEIFPLEDRFSDATVASFDLGQTRGPVHISIRPRE